jgi:hypothetical protein
MGSLFVFSYVLLGLVVIFETVALREAVNKLQRLKKNYRLSPERERAKERLRGGRRAPEFTAKVLGTDRVLTTSELGGHEMILVFAAPYESASPRYQHLDTAIHAMWHGTEGHVYLVCSGGTQEACAELARQARIPEELVLLDPSEEIADRFLIDETPAAWRVDEDLVLDRYGCVQAAGEQITLNTVQETAGLASDEPPSVSTALAGHEPPRHSNSISSGSNHG